MADGAKELHISSAGSSAGRSASTWPGRTKASSVLDTIKGVSDEEDGELVDDDDDLLTGCRRASWSKWIVMQLF